MAEEKYYLDHKIQVEPLVNQWYAWSYLVSPSTASMIVAFSHLKIMRSYIANPEYHEESVKDPKMLGGAFVDLESRQVEKIQELIDEIENNFPHLLELAQSIKKLAELLNNEAKGLSLENLYKEIPTPLKGYVELFYDLNNIAGFRFIESLLYQSIYNLDLNQSILLSSVERDHRPFLFSTPRLITDDKVHLKIPFKSYIYDKLFNMKFIPQSCSYIDSLIFDIKNASKAYFNESLFRSFFIPKPPSFTNDKIKDQNIVIKYFSHACLLIQTHDISILVDPIISYEYNEGMKRYTYADLPDKIDYLVITHAHQDHVLLEHLIQLRNKVEKVIVPKSNCGFLQDPSLKLFFEDFGYSNVIEIDDMESYPISGGRIIGIPFFGEHSDLNIQTKKAHLIELYGKKILCAADSNNLESAMYEKIAKIVGSVDVIFLGMECVGAPLSWIYGPFLTTKITRNMDQSRRLDGSDFKKALELVKIFTPKMVYIYAMGQEPWLRYILGLEYSSESKQITESNKLIYACKDMSIESERLFGYKEIHL